MPGQKGKESALELGNSDSCFVAGVAFIAVSCIVKQAKVGLTAETILQMWS